MSVGFSWVLWGFAQMRRCLMHVQPPVGSVYNCRNSIRLYSSKSSDPAPRRSKKEVIKVSHGPKDTLLLMGYNIKESDLEAHIEALKQALKLKLMSLEYFSDDIAQSFTDLAMAQHQSLKYLDESRKNYINAYEIYKACKGPKSRQVANILCLIGVVSRDLGDIESAKSALTESLEIDRGINNAESNLCSVYALNNLAGIKHLEKDYAEAASLYEEAIKIMLTATYGDPNHRMIALFYYNLACPLAASTDYTGAETALLRAREIVDTIGDTVDLADRIEELLEDTRSHLAGTLLASTKSKDNKKTKIET